MLSFYGGRRGTSFTIERTYDTIPSSISDINLGSYFLVRNDSTNGTNAIYRKTATGYEFIANLLQASRNDNSPSGGISTSVKLNDYSTVATYSSDPSYASGNYNQGTMVSGKTNSSIRYNSYTDNNGISNVGLEIPYPVVEFVANVLPPELITDVVVRDTSASTNFYTKYTINIPQGKTFLNLRVIKPSSLPSGTNVYDPTTDTAISFTDDNYIIVYNQTVYDAILGRAVTRIYYFGGYNNIEDIDITDGVLTITDANGETTTYEFTDIDDITFSDGTLTIIYNNDKPSLSVNLKCLTSLDYDDETSEVTATYNDGTDDVIYIPNFIKNVRVTENSHLLIYYSDPVYREAHGDQETGWVDYGSVTAASGILIGCNLTNVDILEYSGASVVTRETILACLREMFPHGCGIGHGDLVVRYLTDEEGREITDENGVPIVVRSYENITELNYNTMGKVVTVGDANDEKEFYAFDYRREMWYYLGQLHIEDTTPSNAWTIIAAVDDTPETEAAIASLLAVGGVWFGVVGYDGED